MIVISGFNYKQPEKTSVQARNIQMNEYQEQTGVFNGELSYKEHVMMLLAVVDVRSSTRSEHLTSSLERLNCGQWFNHELIDLYYTTLAVRYPRHLYVETEAEWDQKGKCSR